MARKTTNRRPQTLPASNGPYLAQRRLQGLHGGVGHHSVGLSLRKGKGTVRAAAAEQAGTGEQAVVAK